MTGNAWQVYTPSGTTELLESLIALVGGAAEGGAHAQAQHAQHGRHSPMRGHSGSYARMPSGNVALQLSSAVGGQSHLPAGGSHEAVRAAGQAGSFDLFLPSTSQGAANGAHTNLPASDAAVVAAGAWTAAEAGGAAAGAGAAGHRLSFSLDGEGGAVQAAAACAGQGTGSGTSAAGAEWESQPWTSSVGQESGISSLQGSPGVSVSALPVGQGLLPLLSLTSPIVEPEQGASPSEQQHWLPQQQCEGRQQQRRSWQQEQQRGNVQQQYEHQLEGQQVQQDEGAVHQKATSGLVGLGLVASVTSPNSCAVQAPLQMSPGATSSLGPELWEAAARQLLADNQELRRQVRFWESVGVSVQGSSQSCRSSSSIDDRRRPSLRS